MVDHSAGSSGNVGSKAKAGGASWHWQIKLRQVHRSTPQEMYWSFPGKLIFRKGKTLEKAHQFKDYEQDVVDNERPLATIAICRNTKEDRTN